jgi:hypothetical protein
MLQVYEAQERIFRSPSRFVKDIRFGGSILSPSVSIFVASEVVLVVKLGAFDIKTVFSFSL